MPAAPPGPEAFLPGRDPTTPAGRRAGGSSTSTTRPWNRSPASWSPAIASTPKTASTLFRTRDLAGLGALADRARTRLWGDQVFFVFNRQINPTNACVLDCKFCDYAKRPSDPTHYALSIDEMLGKIRPELREVHIVSGLHHEWRFEHYVDIVRQIRRAFPKSQIKAWTAVEIDFFSKIPRKPVEEVLEILVEAGLDSLPGGGAEVFSERIRHELFRHKIGRPSGSPSTRRRTGWGIHELHPPLWAHRDLGGAGRPPDEAPGAGGRGPRVPRLHPPGVQPGYSGIVDRQASAVEDLKTVAAARLIMDNMPHIKSYWVMLGGPLASVGLNFGADDIDGTILEEKIAHAALAECPLGLARDRILGLDPRVREAAGGAGRAVQCHPPVPPGRLDAGGRSPPRGNRARCRRGRKHGHRQRRRHRIWHGRGTRKARGRFHGLPPAARFPRRRPRRRLRRPHPVPGRRPVLPPLGPARVPSRRGGGGARSCLPGSSDWQRRRERSTPGSWRWPT